MKTQPTLAAQIQAALRDVQGTTAHSDYDAGYACALTFVADQVADADAECAALRAEVAGLRAALDSMRSAAATWPGDWSEHRSLWWIYTILTGWEASEIAADPLWADIDAATRARLQQMCATARRAAAAGGGGDGTE